MRELFDDTYGEERTRRDAEGAARLADVTPGGEILDCPCGAARHALVLTESGYRVTAADWSEEQLAEAKQRRGGAEWPQLVQADYRDLHFRDASFDAVLCLLSSLGLQERASDVRVLSEFRRVLRPGCALVIDIMHRDHLARSFQARDWTTFPDGSILLIERDFDLVTGTVATRHTHIPPQGNRVSRWFDFYAHTVSEWVAMLRRAGFSEVDCFGDWDGAPPSCEARLVLRAR